MLWENGTVEQEKEDWESQLAESEEAMKVTVLIGWPGVCDREGDILPKTEGGMEVSHVTHPLRQEYVCTSGVPR